MQLEFFGAAGEVTGSCHVLRVGGSLTRHVVGADAALRDAFRGRGVAAQVARPGLHIDLGSPPDVRG